MANVNNLIISKILDEQTFDELTNLGVRPQHFGGEYEDVYRWITEHTSQHGKVPSKRQFTDLWGNLITLSPGTDQETFSGLAEELFDTYRHRIVGEAMADGVNDLNNGNVAETIKKLQHAVTEANAPMQRILDFNIIDTWGERIERYEEMRKQPNALQGIPTGFHTLDMATHGFRPQQYVVIGGKPKVGKSWAMLIMAMACNDSHRRPLFISYEMSVLEQTMRYDALLAGVDYDKLMAGQLTGPELSRLRLVLKRHENAQDFIMSEDTSGTTTVSAVRAKAIEHKCQALYVDGVYLMDDELGEKKSSPQAIRNINQGLKRLAQELDITVVGSTQLKREERRSQVTDVDSFAFSASWGQDADLLLSMERNPDLDDHSYIKIVEARSAVRNIRTNIKWDFKNMSYDEPDLDDMVLDPAFL